MGFNDKNQKEKYKTYKVLVKLHDNENNFENNGIQQLKNALDIITFDDLERTKEFVWKKRRNTFFEKSNLKIGDEIKFGTYNDKSIPWIVLDIQDGKALLLSKYCLLDKEYNVVYETVTWETCTLRRWLNQEFYKEAFIETEKAAIKTTVLKNPDNLDYSTQGGNNTKDKIFLLSIDEANQYFISDEERKATMADGTSVAWWWLRSPGNLDSIAAFVDHDGCVNKVGNYVDHDFPAIRPVLWVNLDSVLF